MLHRVAASATGPGQGYCPIRSSHLGYVQAAGRRLQRLAPALSATPLLSGQGVPSRHGPDVGSISEVAVDDFSIHPAGVCAAGAIVVLFGHTRIRVIEQRTGEVWSVAAVSCRSRRCGGPEQVGRDSDAYGFESNPGDQGIPSSTGRDWVK
jgi:hypothetical protein